MIHRLLPAAFLLALLSGCAAVKSSTRSVSPKETVHFKEDFDHSDLHELTTSVVDEINRERVLSSGEEKPVLMIAGVENRTSQYIDTQALTDRMRVLLHKTGASRFINETRRAQLIAEQGYQKDHVPVADRVKFANQLGANFMLSGSLAEIRQSSPKQVRVSKKKLAYYKLSLELTDLETGEITWLTDREIIREASLPLIGW